MPKGTHSPAKKTSFTPYTKTGESARDSFRKRLYDIFSEIIKDSKQPVGEWANGIEEELYSAAGPVTSKEYREQTRQISAGVRVRRKGYYNA